MLIDPQGRIVASGLEAATQADADNSLFNPVVAQYTPGVTVTVLLSTDPKPDASDAAAAAANFRLSLKPGQGKVLKLKFKYPTGLPDGAYYVLADAEAGAADVNASNNAGASPAAVTVARPFVSLTGAVAPPPPLFDGRKAVAVLDLTNAGNVPASGVVRVTVYASTGATLDPADRVIAGPGPLRVGLRPGKAKAAKFTFLVPADLAAGSYFLSASVDESALPLNNPSTATLVSGTMTTVS